MSLRLRSLLIISITLLALLATLVRLGWRVVGERYTELEHSEARLEGERVEKALRSELLTLNYIAGDYANWDDTLAFAAGQLQDYPDGFTVEALLNLNADLLAITDADCDVQFVLSVDRRTRQVALPPMTLIDRLGADGHYCQLSESARVLGLESTDQGLLLVAALPILGNDAAGPIGGTFLLARALNHDEIERLGAQFSLTVRIEALGAAAAALLPATRWVETLDSQTVASYVVLDDVRGEAAGLLTVLLPRTIHQQGELSSAYLSLAILLTGLVFAGVAGLMLDRFVIQRITNLNHEVAAIAAQGELTLRVSPHGRDEVGQLSVTINAMLTALEQAQTRLALSREQLRSLLESMEDTVITLDRGACFTGFYGRPLESYGWSSADFLGKSLTESIDEEAARAYTQAVAQVLQGDAAVIDWAFTRPDGSTVYFHTSLSPQRDAGGAVLGIVGVARDVTLLRRIDKARAEFVARIAHELRTPLTSVLGYAELLQREHTGALTAVQRTCLERLTISAQQLQLIVANFSDAAQIEAQRLHLQTVEMATHEFCTHAAQRFAVLAAIYGVKAHTACEPPPCVIKADSGRLEQVLDNLILNALRRAGSGGMVKLAMTARETTFYIAVTDSGAPYSDTARALIFDRFAHPTAPGEDDGDASYSGQEMYTVKAIVEAHSGEIDVRSGIDGNTIEVRLPLARACDVPQDAPRSAPSAPIF